MGIETVVTCDKCGKNLKSQDYVTIEHKFELDHNSSYGIGDERHRDYKIFCIDDGREYWHNLTNEAT